MIFTVATLLGVVLGGLVSRLLGQDGTVLSYIIQSFFIIVACLWPLSIAVRTALIFPAMAVGRPIALRAAWAASKETAGSLIWALLIVGLSMLALSWGVRFGLNATLGIDLLSRSAISAGGYWWLDFLLSPVSNLGLATMLGVVAIAHRDLFDRTPAPETAANVGMAH